MDKQSRKIRFRVILPVIYAVIAIYFAGQCLGSVGHGPACENLYTSGIPAVFVFPKNLSFGIFWAFAAGLIQYFVVGLVIDKIIAAIVKTKRRLNNS